MPNTLQRTAGPPQGPGEGDQQLTGPSSTATAASAERPQPTSGGCCPSEEEEDPEEEHALLTEIKEELFLSKKWLSKKLKNIQYGYI